MTRRALALILGGLTIVRLLLIGRLELSPDEAYYVLWSQHLDLAYYSKGPGIALIIRASTALFGDSETGVRMLAPIFALLIGVLVYVLARRLFGERTALWSALLLQVVPMFNVGALVMTIDPPFLTSWLATLVLAWEAMRRERATPWWIATGLACGAGILCKYTNILVLVGVALAVVLSAQRRRHARGLVLATAVALLAMLPALIWNWRHDWVTVTHLAERGGLDRGAWLRPGETLEFLGTHFGTWSPLIFLAMIVAIPSIVRRARSEDGVRFLLAASAPVLLLYIALALHEAGEANWTAPGGLGLFILAVDHWRPRIAASLPLRITAVAGVMVAALLSVAIMNTDLVRAVGLPLTARNDPTTRLRGWQQTADKVAKLRRRVLGGEPHLLIANHYGVASELAYYMPPLVDPQPGRLTVFVPPTEHPKNQFWFWQRDLLGPGVYVLFVSDRQQPPPDLLEERLGGACSALEPMPIVGRDGDVLRTIHPWLCGGPRR